MRLNALMFSAGLVLGGGFVAMYYKSMTPTSVSSPPSPSSFTLKGTTSKQKFKSLRQVPFEPTDPALVLNPEVLTPRHMKIMEHGLPNPIQIQLKTNFISLIDHRLKEPLWVMEHLSNQTLLGDADRGRVNFKEDADVLPIFRAKQKDYMKSGYSRGHMSAASNNKICPEAMAESFLLNTNIVPQDLDNNMFYWGRMENWIRKLVLDRGFEDVHVISGPLFLPSSSPPKEIPSITPLNQAKETTHPSSSSSSSSSSFHVLPSNSYEPLLSSILLPPPSDVYTPPTSVPSNTTTTTTSLIPGKPFHYMLYKLIGDTQVAVPTHLFKAVLASVGDQRYLACFIVPNTPIADHVPLKLFQVPQSVLEKYTGFVVFDRLMKKGNGVKVLDLCETKDRKGNLCDMGTPEEFQFMVFGKKLKKASSPSHLDTLHQEIQEYAQLRAVNVPKELLRLYHHKKSEFQNHTVKQASPHSVASKKEETSRS